MRYGFRGLALLLLAAAPARSDAEAEAEFVKRLAWIEKEARAGRWTVVARKLPALLEEHREAGYVLSRRAAIVDLTKRCVFRLDHARPEPGDVVSGELLGYRPSSGAIRIRYGRDRMGDWVTQEPLRIHPAVFAGSHSVTVEGDSDTSEDRTGPQVFVCFEGKKNILVDFGLQPLQPVRLQVREAGKAINEVLRDPSPCDPKRPYSVRTVVTSRSVTAFSGSSRLAKIAKSSRLRGRVAIRFDRSVERITLEGTVEKAWIQGLIDKADTEAWKAFSGRFRSHEHLPGWLLAERDVGETGPKVVDGEWPCSLRDPERKLIESVTPRMREGKLVEAAARVESATAADPVLREYLRALIHRQAGRPQRALAGFEKVIADRGEFVPAELRRAELLYLLDRDDEGYRACQMLRARYPGDADLHAAVVLTFLKAGRHDKAGQALQVALRRGLESETLTRVNRMVTKATKGPAWPRTYEYESRHYHVMSDLDRGICVEASRLLEQAHTLYAARLADTGDRPRQRFRVYLFSGQEGYVRYSEELIGSGERFSGGKYIPLLKQLVVWNAPKRERMLQIIRHEGFHQYVDSVMREPPRWFNEGLAVYYEVARVTQQGWRLGEVHDRWLERLRAAGKLVPLEEFLAQDPAAFLKNAYAHYAQAWAFIHFLRHTTKRNRVLFERFWEAFETVPAHEEAMKRALEGRSLDMLDREFAEYVTTLLE